MNHPEILLKLSCPDRVGLLSEVTGFCASRPLNLLEAHQFTDDPAGWFFTRLRLEPVGDFSGMGSLRADLATFASGLGAEWILRERTARPRVAIPVSREGHCLADLGQDCERLALLRGLRYHLEERVFVHGNRTVVFRD